MASRALSRSTHLHFVTSIHGAPPLRCNMDQSHPVCNAPTGPPILHMVRPQHALCHPPSISNAMVRVSLGFLALVSGSVGASAPPHASSVDGALLDPRGGSSILDAPANGGGRSSASSAVTTAAAAAAAAAGDFLTFCVDFDELPEKLAASHDYRVVAVTGCQCSGKSTLLNALFGTG